MKKTLFTIITALLLMNASRGAVIAITDQTFSTSTTLAADDLTLDNATATWTINSGITVTTSTTGTGTRFFVERNTDPDGGSIFVIAGGGTLSVTNGNDFGFRLGHTAGDGTGTLRIQGGSTVNLAATVDGFGADAAGDGGFLQLVGLGSTFEAQGTFNTLNNQFDPLGSTSNFANVGVTVSGGTLQVTDLGGGRTRLSVVPEPSAAALLGLASLGLMIRRKR